MPKILIQNTKDRAPGAAGTPLLSFDPGTEEAGAETGWVAVYGGGSRCPDGYWHDVSMAAPRPVRGDAYCWRCSAQVRRAGLPEYSWTSNDKRYVADPLGIKKEEDGSYIVGGTICNEEILRLAEEVRRLRAGALALAELQGFITDRESQLGGIGKTGEEHWEDAGRAEVLRDLRELIDSRLSLVLAKDDGGK